MTRHLQTDMLLGVKLAPLAPPGRSAGSSTAKTASVKSAPHLSQISAGALAKRQEALNDLDQQNVKVCNNCNLHQTRTNTVFGQGHPAARLVFVGEAPGAEEDRQGLAFVGRAGQLLTKMIEAMGLTRDEVFICNILKCRPPNNRDPAPDEVISCRPYLDKQLEIIKPEVIVALGKPAAQTLLNTKAAISALRGKWHDYYISGSPLAGQATPLMPTFHPAYLLRNPAGKARAWADLQQVMQKLGLPIPKRK
ncbi:MAG: uracil-DNA glycosylase [Planctomycetota bacterium]|nr:MAG: uracil-DNA glycosylase [Planctomycetota bacterium]